MAQLPFSLSPHLRPPPTPSLPRTPSRPLLTMDGQAWGLPPELHPPPLQPLQRSASWDVRAKLESRVTAYQQTWAERCEQVEKGKVFAEKIAQRRGLDAQVSDFKARLRTPKVRSARELLGTPLSGAMTPFKMESVITGRRDAMHAMHTDCIKREEQQKREEIAMREATFARDRAEALRAMREESDFRTQLMSTLKSGRSHRRFLRKN